MDIVAGVIAVVMVAVPSLALGVLVALVAFDVSVRG